MKLSEVKYHLGQYVNFKSSHLHINSKYILTACIMRKNDSNFFYQAELQDLNNKHSILICSLDDIEEDVKWLPAKNANIIQTKPAIILNRHAVNGTVIPIGTVLMPNPIIITDAIIADTLRAAMLVAIQKIIVEIIGISSELILSGLQHVQR